MNNTAAELPQPTLDVIRYLQSLHIEPVLYGSQGVSLYLGAFKKFEDTDLLVDPEWLNDRWPQLIAHMNDAGYNLTNEREHEFKNEREAAVAFADITILVKDGITTSLDDAITKLQIGDNTLQTLTPHAFKRAYEFSAQDGYRIQTRNKKDQRVLELLTAYLAS